MRYVATLLLASVPAVFGCSSGEDPESAPGRGDTIETRDAGEPARPAARPPRDGGVRPDAGFTPTPAGVIPLAITVDDLSRHGPEVPGISRVEIARRIASSLVAHGVPQAYGFVNGQRVERASEQDVLQVWMDAGFPLGNHTYTHIDLREVSVEAFLEDVDRGEAVLVDAMGAGRRDDWLTFRFPFSVEGKDLLSRARIRTELSARGYRIAPVTIDPFDWAYQGTYAACVASGNTAGEAELRRRFMASLAAAFENSVATSDALFGRQINHVLLLHVGAFDAAIMEEMLTFFESRNVRFISLDEALTDPVYATEPRTPAIWGGSFLSQVKASRPGLDLPSSPGIPELDDLCR